MAPLQFVDDYFQITHRNSTIVTELRAGVTLFITSVYVLALNPTILSGAGMNTEDILLATAISTGIGTAIMGLVANYPWVVSAQIGTNVYFVYNVVKPSSSIANCALLGLPVPPIVPPAVVSAGCHNVEVSYKKVLAATFIEGVVFLGIAVAGLRISVMGLFPHTVLMSGASGIGIFIAFVGLRDMGVVVSSAPSPTLITFTNCFMECDYMDGNVNCPWLSLAGLVVTGIFTVYMVSGSLFIGIFFVTFISWAKFNASAPKFNHVPQFHDSAFTLDFAWGDKTGTLIGAFFTFLYLDLIGSSITFYSMGTMMGIIDETTGIIPNSNKAFSADAIGTMWGGLLGSSCLTTYVESASAVKEGGRTGLCAVVCSLLFFLMCFLSPIFAGPIPNIAEGPILVIIGVLVFNDSIVEIDWRDLSEAIPAFLCIIVQPFTNNIAYGAIAGIGAYIIIKSSTYQLFAFQKKLPGYQTATDWLAAKNAKSTKMELGPKGTAQESAGRAPAKEDLTVEERVEVTQ